MDDIIKTVRKLAKNSYWQNFYAHSKELHFRMFENDRDLTNSQMLFLHYLNFYSNLYMEVSMGEVTDVIFKDFIYEDAYNVFRKKNKKKDEKGHRSKKAFDKKADDSRSFSWVFKTPNK